MATTTPRLTAKQAIDIAKSYVQAVFSTEQYVNLGLEEVEFDTVRGQWKVTVGFSRPWDEERTPLTPVTGERVRKRTYKLVVIDDGAADVVAVKNREPL